MAADRRFELRGFELHLDGERLPISTAVVRIVILRQAREGGILPSWDRLGRAQIGRETVERILKLERALAINGLAALLKEAA